MKKRGAWRLALCAVLLSAGCRATLPQTMPREPRALPLARVVRFNSQHGFVIMESVIVLAKGRRGIVMRNGEQAVEVAVTRRNGSFYAAAVLSGVPRVDELVYFVHPLPGLDLPPPEKVSFGDAEAD